MQVDMKQHKRLPIEGYDEWFIIHVNSVWRNLNWKVIHYHVTKNNYYHTNNIRCVECGKPKPKHVVDIESLIK